MSINSTVVDQNGVDDITESTILSINTDQCFYSAFSKHLMPSTSLHCDDIKVRQMLGGFLIKVRRLEGNFRNYCITLDVVNAFSMMDHEEKMLKH